MVAKRNGSKTKDTKMMGPKKPEVKKVVKKAIPKCPASDGINGGKTPAIVAWYKKYKPAEYKRKYHAFELAKTRGKVKV